MKYIRDIRRYMDTWHISMLLQYLNDTKGRAQETLDLLLLKPNSTRKYETEGHIKRAIHNLKQAEESIYKALSLYAEKRPYPRQEQWPPKKRGRKGETRTLQTIMHEVGKGKFEEVETFIKSNSEHSQKQVEYLYFCFEAGYFGQKLPPYKILKLALPDLPPKTTYYRFLTEIKERE